jgi:P27 family predicted phage terminase small subunit
MRGRKPKPTHLKLVRGNPGKRPLNDREPKPAPALPQAPLELSADAKLEWDRIASDLQRLNLLSAIDRGTLAAYCQAYGRWIAAERALRRMAERDQLTDGLMIKTTNGNPVQNPLVGTANKSMSDMVRFAAEFGMTPSARSRIRGEAPEADADGFAEFG